MGLQDSFLYKYSFGLLRTTFWGKSLQNGVNNISLCWPTNISYVQAIAEKYIVLSLKKIGQKRAQIDTANLPNYLYLNLLLFFIL